MLLAASDGLDAPAIQSSTELKISTRSIREKGKPESKRHKLETPQLMTLSWKQAEMSVTGVLYFLRPRSGEARAPAPGAIR